MDLGNTRSESAIRNSEFGDVLPKSELLLKRGKKRVGEGSTSIFACDFAALLWSHKLEACASVPDMGCIY